MTTLPASAPGVRAIFTRGVQSGLATTWMLARIIFPITILVGLLQHTPLMGWLITAITPVMGILGLRGEAAIPLVLGFVLNLYAAIGAMLTMSLTVKEVFILAVMISFAHNMFVESGVALRVGVKLWVVLLVRFGLAFLWALIIKYAWQGGDELARYSFAPAQTVEFTTWTAILIDVFTKATLGVLQVAMIVFPLMICIQFIKENGWLAAFSRRMGRFTRLLCIDPNASLTLVAGGIAGLAYGAGIMVQNVEEDGVSRKSATLAMIFLMACHAVVEDTIVFIALGIPVWPLLALRLFTAIIITAAAGRIWTAVDRRKERLESACTVADPQPGL